MSTPTATTARPTTIESAHWYTKTGEPMHTQTAKAGHERPTTLADAKKLGLLPSPTSILQVLDKPALTNWKIEMACLAVLTAQRQDGEALDAFAHRVLSEERQQDEVGDAAKDLGTQCHDALEKFLMGEVVEWTDQLRAMLTPVCEWLHGKHPVAVERVLVGDGYAGKVDAILRDGNKVLIVDYKTTSKLPKMSYPEHRMQLSSYAAAYQADTDVQPCEIVTVNVYISKTEPGKIAVCENLTWLADFTAFELARDLWCYLKGYTPAQSVDEACEAVGL
jgi:hypothetical protein